MAIALITGSSGLVGSETAKFLSAKGFEVIGIDNNMREYFFGQDASTKWNTDRLVKTLKNFSHHSIDIRDKEAIYKVFSKAGKIELVVHTAAQPSHDWAAKEPITDFSVNANGTLTMLEATKQFCPDATFIFTSTNKVYGDRPNTLPLVELKSRWEIDSAHAYFNRGIDEQMSIDQSKHSLFGVSKVAADLMVQEYGKYFGIKTAVFRGGCLTGPSHSGTELHGFLSYLVKCIVQGKPYIINGYKGKQVRDNIHSVDLVNAFWEYFLKPQAGEVYNIGGGLQSNCSMLEAINLIEKMTGKELDFKVSTANRSGDHIWWISDINKFKRNFPNWKMQYNIESIIKEIVEATVEREAFDS